jgi:hypothetical protein
VAGAGAAGDPCVDDATAGAARGLEQAPTMAKSKDESSRWGNVMLHLYEIAARSGVRPR